MSKMITGFHEKKCTKTSHTSLHPIFYPINKLDRQANRQWNKNNSNLNKMLQNKEHVHLLSWQTNMTTIHQHSFTRQSCILNTIQFFTKVNISKKHLKHKSSHMILPNTSWINMRPKLNLKKVNKKMQSLNIMTLTPTAESNHQMKKMKNNS